jgi:hypothetical protein
MWIRWAWLKAKQKLGESMCSIIGHRLPWYHPQQVACECTRCKWIIERDGVTVAHAPL